MTSPQIQKIERQSSAVVSDYLAELLITDSEEEVTAAQSLTEVPDEGVVTAEAEVLEEVVEQQAPEPDAGMAEPTEGGNAVQAAEAQVEEYPEPEQMLDEIPAAIQPGEDFCAHIVDVGVMKLAVPQQAVESILDFPADLEAEEGTPEWVLGSARDTDSNITVIDLGYLLKGEKTRPAEDCPVLHFKGTEWALMGTDIFISQTVEADWPRWREDLSTKPWLSATISQHRCALLDVPGFIEWLDHGAPAD